MRVSTASSRRACWGSAPTPTPTRSGAVLIDKLLDAGAPHLSAEDIDLFIDYMDRDTFRSFAGELLARGFYFLNSDDVGEIYSMLRDGLAVRIAEEERIIPNVEMKFKKDDVVVLTVSGRGDKDVETYLSHKEMAGEYGNF